MQALLEIDKSLLLWIHHGMGHSTWDGFFNFISSRWMVLYLLLFLGSVMVWKKYWSWFWLMVVVTLAVLTNDAIVYNVFKNFFARPRPCKEFEELLRALPGCAGHYGFPSNHASNTMTAAVLLSLLKGKNWGIPAFINALLVGFSRIYLGVHYPLDVVSGFAWGAVMGYLSYKIIMASELRNYVK